MRRFLRAWSGLFVLLLAASMLLGGTLAWKSLDQTARNDMRQLNGVPVELVKLEKRADGTATENPIPGAEFFLFTAGGKQIGGRYLTDELGKIAVTLEPGEYYFQETYPSFDYDFDLDDSGQPITRYPFTVREKEDKVLVTAYNRHALGTLTVTKEVGEYGGAPLTEAQQSQLFTFTVTFSDGGSYPCVIDGGEPQTIPSGGTFRLRHGQAAVFSGVPVGVRYTVTEEKVDGCATFVSGSHGTILREGRTAAFKNVWNHPIPTEPPVLVVTKVLSGNVPPEDWGKEFRFTLTLNGEATEFTLRPGANGGHDSVSFDNVAYGDVYSVTEANGEEFVLATDKASGTIALPRTEATFTNAAKSRPQVDIGGEKTWVVDEEHRGLIPKSIPVRLYGDGLLIEEQTLRPNAEGKWLYSFSAPKFDFGGREIVYTIQEGPVDHFAPSYDGRNIVNTYVPPVKADPPILVKVVEGTGTPVRQFRFVLQAHDGAPLPEGAPGSVKRYTLDGSGELELGWFTFTRPGTFVYTVYETPGGESGWSYDDARYTLTFEVVVREGVLEVQRTLTRNGQPSDKLAFHNKYTAPTVSPPDDGGDDDDDDDDIRVSGRKRWSETNAPKGSRPESVIVLVYANGEVVHRQEVTAKNGWRYAVNLPKYDKKGNRIVYTVGEEPVPGYEVRVDGWDLVNTYVGVTPTPTPGAPESTIPTSTAAETTAPTPTAAESGSPESTPTATTTETTVPTPESSPPPQGTGTPPPSVPKTGDDQELPIWLGITVSGGLGMLLCLGYLFWKKHHYVGKRLMKK